LHSPRNHKLHATVLHFSIDTVTYISLHYYYATLMFCAFAPNIINCANIMHLLTDTTKMEEAVVSRRVLQNLHERGITVTRYYCGHYMTSLDMAGLSVTIMRYSFLKYL
jgi:Dak1 domain